MSSPDREVTDYAVQNFPPEAECTAEMPMLWNEDHRMLIDSCVRSDALYELYLQLPKLAKDLASNVTLRDNNFSVVETVNALRNRDWAMCELLHSIPLKVVQSIVKNTVAYDDHNGDFPCFSTPQRSDPEEIPGVYVIGISVQQERGRFLNITEMERVIDDVKKYIVGYQATVQYEADVAEKGVQFARKNLSPEQDSARRHLRSVDKWAECADISNPVFITKDEEIPRIRALVETFKKMCNPSLDPTKSVRMIQSPLYVGCSKNLADRTNRYSQKSLRGINKPLGLTLAILKRQNIRYTLHTRVVVRIWKKDQLPLAEQLVTTLAGSLVYQHGFNATEGGGTGPNTVTSREGLKTNAGLVICRLGLLYHNVKESIEEIEIRTKFLQDLDIVNGEIVEMSRIMEQCTAELESLPQDYQWNQTLTDLEQLVQDLQEDLEDKQQALRFWDLLLEIQKIVVEETGRGLWSL
ncbi:hypothetical protein FAVG1_00315 [Fusarium avenaceum]|nr:hypothetical protein FAVG1_00315 [Fusarium avenaceum]